MFLGDADHQAKDIRPASVKGMLRFWWRALQWQNFRGNVDNDEKALKALHAQEARLFGSAANQGVGGQGVFLLRIIRNDVDLMTTNKDSLCEFFQPTRTFGKNNNRADEKHLAAVRYLAYGLVEAFSSTKRQTQAGQLQRACINENQFFTVQLLFHKTIDQSILDAVKIMGLLGGLGSRTRRGFGSITLESLASNRLLLWKAPADSQQYKVEILSLLPNQKNIPESPYSAFSENSRIDVLLKGDSASEVLDQIGLCMLDYRSWGRSQNGNMLPSGKPSEKRFKDDHDWSKNPYSPRFHMFHPCRIIFGLPHSYGQHTVKSEHFERRASPLMFHIHRLNENEHLGVSVLLQSQFLPENEQISWSSRDQKNPNHVKANVNYLYLHDFLDGSKGNPPCTDLRFPDRSSILS